MTGLLFDHLWQSMLMLAAAAAIVFLLHGYSAATRHAVWLAASVKFLVPFALLAWLGSLLPLRPAPSALAVIGDLTPLAQPFSGPAPLAAMPALSLPDLTPWLLALWAAGIGVTAALWLARGAELKQLARTARPVNAGVALPVRASRQQLEPGLVGIARPVILLPDGIMEHLNQAEIDAILAHELCHWRRRDNFTGALHMLVTALFWFWPPVWWLGGRLIEERERACDEAVVAQGADRRAYADGILKVCKLYLHSPLAAAAGVASGSLRLRLEAIMADRRTRRLGAAQKALLAAGAMMALALPIAAGMLEMTPVTALRMGAMIPGKPAFAASAQAAPEPLPPPLAGARARHAATASAAGRSFAFRPAASPMPYRPEALAAAAAPDIITETEAPPAPGIIPGSAMAVSGSMVAPAPGGGAGTIASSGGGKAGLARGGNSYDLNPYLARVAGQIQRHLQVPVSLQAYSRDRLGGTVLLHLVFRPDGSVQLAEVAKGSGFRGFDEAALQAVHRAAPLPPLPPEARVDHINGVIPVSFSITGL